MEFRKLREYFFIFAFLFLLIFFYFFGNFKCVFDTTTTISSVQVTRTRKHWQTATRKTNCSRKQSLDSDGSVVIKKTSPSSTQNILDKIDPQSLIQPGGLYVPLDCEAKCTTAIIVPYKNREEQLKTFLQHMHPILMRMQISYRIFVIEQNDTHPFNRAKLFNIGYKEATTSYDEDFYTCFVFHDVDLLLENELNSYCCEQSPRYMCPAIDVWGYASFSELSFGGVVGFKRNHFEQANGYSNKYWGWGAEDDDLYWRLHHRHLKVTRPSLKIGRYTMLSHGKQPANGKAMKLLIETENGRTDTSKDGLNTLRYNVKTRLDTPLYTHVVVDLQMTEAEKNLTNVKI